MSYYLPVGITASDIPQVGGGSSAPLKFYGTTAKDSGPGFFASLAAGFKAVPASALPGAPSTTTAPAAPAARPATPPGMSTNTKLLIGGGVAAALLLVLALK